MVRVRAEKGGEGRGSGKLACRASTSFASKESGVEAASRLPWAARTDAWREYGQALVAGVGGRCVSLEYSFGVLAYVEARW